MESVTAPERPHRRMGAGVAQATGTQVPVGAARPAPARATSGVSRPGPPGKPEPGVCPGKDRVTAAPGKQSSRPAREGRRCPEPWPCMPHTEREHLHSRAAPGCRAWLGRGLWQGGFTACAWGRPVAATQPSPPGQSGTRSCRCRPQDTGKVVGLRLGCPLEPWQGPSGTARVDPPGQRMKTFLKVQPRPGTRGTRPEMRAGEAHPCKPRTLGPSPPETESWGLAGKPAPQTDLGQG